MPTLRCSVVIPTFNAAHTISTQLASLADQVGAEPFEVVISDNGSTDDLAAVVDTWQTRLPHLRRVDASRAPGVSVARNIGISSAATDQILICDADDQASTGWVAAYQQALTTHAFAGGPVETTRLSGASAAWVPIEERTTDLFTSWEDLRYPIGCNMAFRREVWTAVEGFAEDYPAGAEEIDFAWRARQAGFEASYVPDALLHYRIRTDLRGVLRQQFNSGRGTAKLYAAWRPAEVTPKSWRRRLHHEWLLLRRCPWSGSSAERRRWLSVIAFEAGKLREARRLGTPAP